jgi:hypothetical protein
VSLIVDLAVLAEGAAADSRGSITLVGVNPNVLLAETFPVQFSPILLVTLKDDEEAGTFRPGRVVAATVKATGPDGEVIFIAPAIRQVITPSPLPALSPKINVIAQVPFTASKSGTYTVSARMTVIDGDSGAELAEASTERTVIVSDLNSLKAKPAPHPTSAS